MTAKKELKKIIRQRQTTTGERYTTARQHVLSQPRRSAISVIEFVELSAEAAQLGFRCRAALAPQLAEQVRGEEVLRQLRDALSATHGDPAMALFRAVVFQGEHPRPMVWKPLALLDEGRRFIERARAGIGGTSESGMMLALHVAGAQGPQMVVCLILAMPWLALAGRAPSLLLVSADGLSAALQYAPWRLR